MDKRTMVIGAIMPWEISTVREKTRIGDTVKFYNEGCYELRHGVVLGKYQYHALCKVNGHRESVCWVDVIRGGK